jgi:TolB-like protein/class 3 adenylate cyclase/Tfp pilus assembly protein PilF
VNISAESAAHSELEIGHVLFMDVVGYSQLLNNEQREIQRQLTEIVRQTQHFRAAEAVGKLVRLPVGDGMALVFFNSPEAPAHCACEISQALKAHPHLKLRIGIHSGPVSGLTDVNDHSNVAGAGINIAQRIMDCGDAGHILLSKRAADDLAPDGKWRSQLHELGECFVKHGIPVAVVNLYSDQVGNPQLPEKIKLARRKQTRTAVQHRSLFAGAAVLLGAVLTLIIFARHPFRSASPAPGAERSVAVLPLENLSEEKGNAFLADGIQDELLSNLAKIKNLKVISRTSVMQYKTGITRNLKEIAQQLGVTNVVEGTVSRSGTHVRVNVQLIDALTDHHIWTQVYDRTLADSLALQGELATEIAAGVGATLSPLEKARVEATPTKNTVAYDAYLRGRAFTSGVQSDRSNVQGAIQSFQEAVRLDPNFVLAWAYLSYAQSQYYWSGADSSAARLAAAKDAFDRAVALDPDLPEVHLALGYYRYYGQRDFTGALAEFRRAEEGLPNNVDVSRAIGLINRRLGHWDEGIAAQRRAVELDPRNAGAALELATTYGVVRRFPEALASLDRVLAFEPANPSALGMKALDLWAIGNIEAAEPLLANPAIDPTTRGIQAMLQQRYPAAIEIFSKVLAEEPISDNLWVPTVLALCQQRTGNAAAARATLQQASQNIRRRFETVPPDSAASAELHSSLGRVYAGLGEAASAVAEGEKGVALQPTSKDPFEGPGRETEMATIYALLGDADHAIPILRRLLQIPCGLEVSAGLLRVEPVWDQIRNDPRFQELTSEKP